jgi:hypothetical protein
MVGGECRYFALVPSSMASLWAKHRPEGSEPQAGIVSQKRQFENTLLEHLEVLISSI